MVDGASFRLADEIRYITRRAAEHDGRVVTIGQLTLFSSETGDAWIIEKATIASKAQPSSTLIATPAAPQP